MARSGSQRFAVLLCAFDDTIADVPNPRSHYVDLFANRGTGGLNDYWIAASQGAINLDGTDVFDWMSVGTTSADYVATRPSRWDKIRGAIEAFGLADSTDYVGFVALFNASVGDAGAEGGVLAGPGADSLTFLAHETGHVLGLAHSFDQSDRKSADWSAPGEYFDSYDIMSAMNVSTFAHSRFLASGPLLCAANLDLMGWLPPSRVWSPPADRSSVTDIDIVSLGHPDQGGYLAIRAGGTYVEHRTADGWDAGLARPCVLIHVHNGANATVLAQDRATNTNEWQPGQDLGPTDVAMAIVGGTRISVLGFDAARSTARIRVAHQVARPIVAGPAVDVFGGVGVDGGGIIIVGGKVVRVPPRSPVLAMMERLAMVSQAQETLGEKAQATVVTAVLREVEQLARQARQR